MLGVEGFGVDDWWGCVVTSLVPPTTPNGASERRLWGRGLRGVGGVLINPLPTAYHEHRPSEGNEIIPSVPSANMKLAGTPSAPEVWI